MIEHFSMTEKSFRKLAVADDIDLLGSNEENCSNSLKDWSKQRLNTAWKLAP